MRISLIILILVLFSGFFAITFNNVDDAQGSSNCDLKCQATNNDAGNIEKQIPSVIPFP
jgi:hypothetical protein